MKSSTTAMICVMGVFLITLLGLSHADVDPGETAQESIRDEIQEGVNTDSITFWKLVDNALQIRSVLSKARVCSRISAVHNKFNAGFLGGVTIERRECERAFLHPLKYNTNRLNFWAGTHCGEWGIVIPPFDLGAVVPDDAEWDVAPQPPPQTITQDVTYSHRGQPHGAFNRVDGTVSNMLLHIDAHACFIHHCYILMYMPCMYYRQASSNSYNNKANLLFNRVILEDMIQRTQLTTRAIRAPMWAMLSHHRLDL